jgi:hypothetical protein
MQEHNGYNKLRGNDLSFGAWDVKLFAAIINFACVSNICTSGLYYETITIVIDAPSVVKSDAPNCSVTY